MYSPEALKTIALIEKRCNIDWNNDAQRQQLTDLDLSSKQITDLSPLSVLTHLTTLVLEDNTITDITPLTHLTQLTKLFLGWNKLTDISPLAHLTQLTELNLWNNQIINKCGAFLGNTKKALL